MEQPNSNNVPVSPETVAALRSGSTQAMPALWEKLAPLYKRQFLQEREAGPRDGLILGLIHSILILTVMRHIAWGCPLECPPVVVEGFRRAGFVWDAAEGKPHAGELVCCTSCGYGLAASFKACPLCKGETGPFVLDGPGTSAKRWN